jgi:hypothetical protein
VRTVVELVHAVTVFVAVVVVVVVVVALVFPSVCLAVHRGTIVLLLERKDPDHTALQNRHHLPTHKLLHAMLHHLSHFRHDALLPLHRFAHLRELIVGLVVVVGGGMTTQAETGDERAKRSREGRTMFAPARLVGESERIRV